MAEDHSPIRVAALYKFARLDDCLAVRQDLARLCCAAGLKGTLLLAGEGINGTIAGSDHAIESALAFIRNLPGFADLEVKYSTAETMPFHRMKVRIKREIVTMGQASSHPSRPSGSERRSTDRERRPRRTCSIISNASTIRPAATRPLAISAP